MIQSRSCDADLHEDGVISRTIEPLAYVQHSDGRGDYIHQFGRVGTLRILS